MNSEPIKFNLDPIYLKQNNLKNPIVLVKKWDKGRCFIKNDLVNNTEENKQIKLLNNNNQINKDNN